MISIRYNELLKILRESRKREQIKGNLPQYEVAKLSKIHVKILSKLANHPDAEVTLSTIEKLITFFFEHFAKAYPPGVKTKKDLLDWVVLNLIEVFPDSVVKTADMKRSIIERSYKGTRTLLRQDLVKKLLERDAK